MKRKQLVIMSVIIVLVVVVVFVFFKSAQSRKESVNKQDTEEANNNEIIDERTGKSFEVKDGKVIVYLPVKVVSASDSDYDNYDKTVSYDDKARMIGYNYNYKQNGESINSKMTFSYDNKDHLMCVSEDLSSNIHTSKHSFEYKNDSITEIITDNTIKESEDDGSIMTSWIHEYNSNGMIMESYNTMPKSSGRFGEDISGRKVYFYDYDENNRISRLSYSDDYENYDKDISYDDSRIKEAIWEGTLNDKTQKGKISLIRENGNIINLNHDSSDYLTKTKKNIDFVYEGGRLSSVNINSEKPKEYCFDYIFEYDGSEIKNISVSSAENYDWNYSYNYENGNITEVRARGVGSTNKNSYMNVRIEYKQFSIDMDYWNKCYKDYYYSFRYYVLENDLGVKTLWPAGVIEMVDGYFDKKLECYTVMAENFNDEWFWLVTLPKVISDEYYKDGSQ